jgi:dihydroorotate dehydrogenase electron transfer subunit
MNKHTDMQKDKIFSLPTELPFILPIDKITQECIDIRTFHFRYRLDFLPGQFVMVWIPRLDEKPFTISYHTQDSFGISVQEKGEFTKALFKMKKGDKLGFRGPYGNSFNIIKGESVIIGGGCGTAPIAPLIDAIKSDPNIPDPYVIIGARSKENLIFTERYPDSILVTDDGSKGKKAYTTDALKEYLIDKIPDMVYTCGPEIMMKKVVDICNDKDIPCQASLERYMKCGFGVCGQCVCSKKRVCVEGPVFTKEDLVRMDDFGNFTRLNTGEKISL